LEGECAQSHATNRGCYHSRYVLLVFFANYCLLSSSLLCLLSDLHLQHQQSLHPSLPDPVGCGKLASRISSFQNKVKETLRWDEAQTRRRCISASDGQPAATRLHTLFFSTASSVVARCERRITMSCSQLRMVTSHVTFIDPLKRPQPRRGHILRPCPRVDGGNGSSLQFAVSLCFVDEGRIHCIVCFECFRISGGNCTDRRQ
jgi:hypothetical protein